jgi:hypothetical protein
MWVVHIRVMDDDDDDDDEVSSEMTPRSGFSTRQAPTKIFSHKILSASSSAPEIFNCKIDCAVGSCVSKPYHNRIFNLGETMKLLIEIDLTILLLKSWLHSRFQLR